MPAKCKKQSAGGFVLSELSIENFRSDFGCLERMIGRQLGRFVDFDVGVELCE
jgi:hypothetical protein